MKVKKTESVKIVDLKQNLFVRQTLDQDHVLYLAELIENGVQLPPINVSDEMVVVDGRHRIEAHELNKLTEVMAQVVTFESETELISEAYKANTGGSKPPTPADTEHTVALLLERGETMKRIGELLALPTGMARRYANEVKSRMNRAKLQAAARAVTDGGLTVAKSAEQYEVDAEKLKEILSGHRRKHKQGIQELQRTLTSTHKSLSLRNASAVKKILEKYEDGDVTEKQVRDVFKHIEDLQKNAARSMADWKKRFEGMNGTHKAAEKVAKTA